MLDDEDEVASPLPPGLPPAPAPAAVVVPVLLSAAPELDPPGATAPPLLLPVDPADVLPVLLLSVLTPVLLAAGAGAGGNTRPAATKSTPTIAERTLATGATDDFRSHATQPVFFTPFAQSGLENTQQHKPSKPRSWTETLVSKLDHVAQCCWRMCVHV